MKQIQLSHTLNLYVDFDFFSFLFLFRNRPTIVTIHTNVHSHHHESDNMANWYAETNAKNGLCSVRATCWKGYCWAHCGGNLKGGNWCYTTKGASKDNNYVKCVHNFDCNPCWNCAGACGT